MTDVKITHIEAEPSDSAVDPLQIVVTPGNDPQIGERVFGFKDGAGNPHKCLNKSAHAPVKSINVSDFSAAGLVRTDASGDLYGDVNTLGELNTALGGTTIDESTDPRDPNAHAIGGAAHSASTLAELNALVSDATLDDSNDPRQPTQHAVGSATYHSASTLAELNALVSDATLDDSSDSRTPTAHAASHESGGLDQLEHNKFYDLNTDPYKHYDSTPASGATGWEVTDTDFTNLGDNASVKPTDLTIVRTGEVVTDSGWGYLAAGKRYVFYSNNVSIAHVIDARTCDVIFTKSSLYLMRAVFINDNILFCAISSGVVMMSIENNSIITLGSMSLTLAGIRICTDKNGAVYVQVSSGTVYIWPDPYDLATYTSKSFTGITAPSGLFVDIDGAGGDGVLYVVDETVNNTTIVVKSFNLDTTSIITTSNNISCGEGAYSAIDMYEGKILLMQYTAVGGTANTMIHKLLDPTTLSIDFAGTSEVPGQGAGYCCGFMYTRGSSTYAINKVALAGLTQRLPYRVNATNVKSLALSDPGITGVYSGHDIIKSILASHSLYDSRLGLSVLSIETSVPASPAEGGRYLLDITGDPRDKMVAEYQSAIGYTYYKPVKGDIIYDLNTSARLEYSGSAWVAVGLLTATDYVNLTSGASTSVPHVHRPSIRTTSVSDDVELTDEGNIIEIASASGAVAINFQSSVLAVDGFRVGIQCADHSHAYTVTWGVTPIFKLNQLNSFTDAPPYATYWFTVRGSKPVPDFPALFDASPV